MWHAIRGRLLLRTPGHVPLWDLQVFLSWDQSLLNLSCFRTLSSERPSVIQFSCHRTLCNRMACKYMTFTPSYTRSSVDTCHVSGLWISNIHRYFYLALYIMQDLPNISDNNTSHCMLFTYWWLVFRVLCSHSVPIARELLVCTSQSNIHFHMIYIHFFCQIRSFIFLARSAILSQRSRSIFMILLVDLVFNQMHHNHFWSLKHTVWQWHLCWPIRTGFHELWVDTTGTGRC